MLAALVSWCKVDPNCRTDYNVGPGVPVNGLRLLVLRPLVDDVRGLQCPMSQEYSLVCNRGFLEDAEFLEYYGPSSATICWKLALQDEGTSSVPEELMRSPWAQQPWSKLHSLIYIHFFGTWLCCTKEFSMIDIGLLRLLASHLPRSYRRPQAIPIR